MRLSAALILSALSISAFACTRNEPSGGSKSAAPSDSAKTAEAQPFKELSISDVEQKLAAAQKPYVYDANPREVYDKHHVPGATWIQFDQVVASMFPADKNAQLIFYCANTH